MNNKYLILMMISFAWIAACSPKTEVINQEENVDSNRILLSESQLKNAGIQAEKPQLRELGKPWKW